MAKKNNGLAAMLAREKAHASTLEKLNRRNIAQKAKGKKTVHHQGKKTTRKLIADAKKLAGDDDNEVPELVEDVNSAMETVVNTETATEVEVNEANVDPGTAPKTPAEIVAKIIRTKRALIPFKPSGKILLIGEGDFSFASSIVITGLSYDVVATSFDSEKQVLEKYPETVSKCLSTLGINLDSLKADNKKRKFEDLKSAEIEESNDHVEEVGGVIEVANESPETTEESIELIENSTENEKFNQFMPTPKSTVYFNIDGTKLPTYKQFRRLPLERRFDCVMFNYPHTGKGITDQDRNVLDNQKMLMGVFESVKYVLRYGPMNKTVSASEKKTKEEEEEDEDDAKLNFKFENENVRPRGVFAVTLFDSMPYTLWNIKTLAKNSGYRLVRSGPFEWDAFPGYAHKKTKGLGDTNKRAETRNARVHVFEMVEKYDPEIVVKPKLKAMPKRKQKGRKRENNDRVI